MLWLSKSNPIFILFFSIYVEDPPSEGFSNHAFKAQPLHLRLFPRPEDRSGAGSGKMPNEKILIVDDEENIRFLYEQELIDEGYQTVLAQDGKECLEKVEAESPDLIILDIRMPKMDGLEAIGKIIELNKSIPIIINTAYSTYKDDFMSWAADAYVVKSYDLDSLKSTIKEVLNKKKSKS